MKKESKSLNNILLAVKKNWSDEFSEKIGTNTSHVKDFLSKAYLENKLDIALHGNRHSLDNFVDLGDPKLLFHALQQMLLQNLFHDLLKREIGHQFC